MSFVQNGRVVLARIKDAAPNPTGQATIEALLELALDQIGALTEQVGALSSQLDIARADNERLTAALRATTDLAAKAAMDFGGHAV